MSKNVNNDVSKDSPIAKGVRRLMYAAFPRVKRKGLYCDSNIIIHIELDFVTWNLSTYHLLPPGSVLGIPPRTQREPRGGTILLFFSPWGRGEFSFRNDYNGPRRHTRKICSRPARWKVLYLVPWSTCENDKKIAKNGIHLSVIFANEKEILYFDLTIKGWRTPGCYVILDN